MDINKIVEENINKEKEFYAHINLFKLILTAELSGKDYDYFCLMGGFNRLKKLEKDISEDYICLSEKELFQLYFRMFDLKEELSKISTSKSTTLNKALKEFNMVSKYYEGKEKEERNTPFAFDKKHLTNGEIISWLKENIPEELINKVEKLDGKEKGYVKKLGERK